MSRLCGQIEYHLGEAVALLIPQVDEKISLFRRAMTDEIEHRIDAFARDLEVELSHLGQPLSPQEARALEELRARVVALADRIEKFSTSLADEHIEPP